VPVRHADTHLSICRRLVVSVLQLCKAQLVLQASGNGASIALGELEVSAMPPEFKETWAAGVAQMRAGRIIHSAT
jgi:hypothetical protein